MLFERVVRVEQLLKPRVDFPFKLHFVHGDVLVTEYGWSDESAQCNVIALVVGNLHCTGSLDV